KITKGFKLPARFVIHTVGPIYKNGLNNEAQLLAKCYKNSLALAQKHHLKTIAFSAISTGGYGSPLDEATEICVSTVEKLLTELKDVEEVIFVVFDEAKKEVYENTFEQLGI